MRGRPCSRIDYLLIPIRLKEKFEAKVLTKLGFEIQAAQRCLMLIDHMPLQVQIRGRTLWFGPEDQHNRGWNQSQMLDYWVAGTGREAFLVDLVEQMNQVEEKFNQLEMQNNATAMYQTVHTVVREVAKRNFWNVNVTGMKNYNIVQLKKMKLQAINQRTEMRRILITSRNKFEAMKIASRSWIKTEVLANMQKRVILKSVMQFWREQQKFEQNTKKQQ